MIIHVQLEPQDTAEVEEDEGPAAKAKEGVAKEATQMKAMEEAK